jgi:hypothetical protein
MVRLLLRRGGWVLVGIEVVVGVVVGRWWL